MQSIQLERHFAAIRAEAEDKIKELELAAKVCEDMGYEIDTIPNVTRLFTEAVEESASKNGYAHGDSYKPFDPDMAFPTEDTLKPILQRELNKMKIERPAQKSFRFA